MIFIYECDIFNANNKQFECFFKKSAINIIYLFNC